MSARSFFTSIIAFAVVVSASALVRADPYPDQILKFQQKPMIATPIPGTDGTTAIYYGHDELSTAYGSHDQGYYPQGQYMADDFADRFDSPVVHVRWWGSYLDIQPDPGALGVRKFLIAWESDVPAGAGDPGGPTPLPYSHPGDLLMGEVVNLAPTPPVSPPPGFFTVKPVPGSNPLEPVYEYNAELACPFPQKADTVYWLKIVALVDSAQDGSLAWGWHNRDYTVMDPLASPVPLPGEHLQGVTPGGGPIWHFQDDAVTGPVSIQENPSDPWQPFVDQVDWNPTNYIDGVDGPVGDPLGTDWRGIGSYSKDLAFELYTIPEPATLALLGIGSMLLARRRK